MITGSRNKAILHFDVIVVMVILFFAVLVHYNSTGYTVASGKAPATAIITEKENSAVSTPCLRLHVYQKTWILNRDNFDLLAFNRSPFVENNITGIQVSYFQKIRRSLCKVPQFILRYHLFPLESDAWPNLG
jgi:hypothetical protein